MSSKIAIDVALLPPDKIMDEAIKINRQFKSRFSLNKTNCLPHITLSQAIFQSTDLPEIVNRLQKIAADFRPLKLRSFVVNQPSAMFEVAKSNQLGKLHERVMSDFTDLASYDVKQKYFYDGYIREKSLNYVRDFLKVAYKNYYPHITLGPEQANVKQDLDFTCDRLTICHLGNFNTCRKLLFEIPLC